MFTFVLILIIVVCILLTLVVLIQNPKGGGIAANFTAPNQIMGAKRSTDVVEKTTWILAIVLIVFSLASNFIKPENGNDVATPESRIKENIENVTVPAQQAPAAQPAAPAQEGTAPATDGAAQPATTQPAAE